jgi:Icc-related predicted phosphoesterase
LVIVFRYSSCVAEWYNHHPGAPLQSYIEPLILKYKVDLFMSGHIHVYERIYPVMNGTVVATGDVYTNPAATVHVIQGTGGTFFESVGFVDPIPDW